MKNREDIYKITSIVLMMDQFLKLLICHKMKLFDEIPIIPHFFSIQYVENTGAAFSILRDSTILLIVISAVVVVVLDRIIKKEKNFSKLSILSYGLILGGIFGNMIDRIIHHSVIDYLSFQFGKYSFPIFNLADTAIVVGVFLMIYILLLEKKGEEKNEGDGKVSKVLPRRKGKN